MATSDRLIELFNAAHRMAPGIEREQFLAAECQGEAGLKEQVLSLLQAQDRAAGFLHARPPLDTEIEAEFSRLKPEGAGENIGPYKLMEQIGEGGFGTVWVADQEKPVRRRVALKIVKLGMDTKDVIARFEQERQALAMMDHPNIARVLDAGATDLGRPYFVMELVRGVKITDYCDQANLSTAERLALFTQVCSAVQHAHQHGIIHRDLKPSNILVTLHDGVPVPKVIDFGVAKATQQQRLTDLTIYTQFQQMIGTPLYMSPEQAEMSGLDVDTRSDIYSLGVLLYELLTGRTPFDPQELMKAGLDEIRRVIREKEPQTPSMFLKTMPQERRATVAQQRQSDPAKLANSLRGDLDWIVMKALEKDRQRRYVSANAFAEDIQRHLANRPVVACPPSAAYLLKKHILRNRTAYATTLFAFLATLAALIAGMRISDAGRANSAAARGEPTPRPLRLLSGVVIAEDTGAPLANTLIRVAAPSMDMREVRGTDPNVVEGRTDREGRFKIQVPQAETLSLDAMAPGYESASGTLMAGSRLDLEDLPFKSDSSHDFTIKLSPALYVAGVVVDEDGRPFPDVEVEATLAGDGLANIKFAETDSEGRFEIYDYPLDRQGFPKGRLRFAHPTVLRSEVEDVYALDENARRSIRVVMRRGHDIRGVITTAAGRPAVKTLIEAVPADSNALYKRQFTDNNGQYVLQGLPDGDILVRVHSLLLEQKARKTVRMAGADVDVNLRLEPVIMKEQLSLTTVLGMKLADITPELKAAYDLADSAKGVLIVDPGDHHERLAIGSLKEGEYFWMVGNKRIANLREMIDEFVRINELARPTDRPIDEGYHGSIRIVYSNQHRSSTQYMKLTDADAKELRDLSSRLARDGEK